MSIGSSISSSSRSLSEGPSSVSDNSALIVRDTVSSLCGRAVLVGVMLSSSESSKSSRVVLPPPRSRSVAGVVVVVLDVIRGDMVAAAAGVSVRGFSSLVAGVVVAVLNVVGGMMVAVAAGASVKGVSAVVAGVVVVVLDVIRDMMVAFSAGSSVGVLSALPWVSALDHSSLFGEGGVSSSVSLAGMQWWMLHCDSF